LAGGVTGMGKKINAYWISVCKPEGKRRLERRGRRWEYSIKIDLKETGLENVDWILLVQGGLLL
jgi:hypothetical protein